MYEHSRSIGFHGFLDARVDNQWNFQVINII